MGNLQLMFVKRAILVVHHAREIRTIVLLVLQVSPYYQTFATLIAL